MTFCYRTLTDTSSKTEVCILVTQSELCGLEPKYEHRSMKTEPSKKQQTFVAKLDSISFRYGQQELNGPPIFDNFEFHLKPGRLVALIGPSGCGKSTLLNLLAGLIHPQQGSVFVDRREYLVGYMFQEYPFLPRKTVLEHIAFPLRMQGRKSAEAHKIAKRWIEKVMLKEAADARIGSLSVGMKARVALCTTLVSEPGLLLFDEPFHALDLETRVRMWQLLRETWKQDLTSGVMVTHDLNEAIVLGDTVSVMSKPPCKILLSIEIPFGPEATVQGILENPVTGPIH